MRLKELEEEQVSNSWTDERMCFFFTEATEITLDFLCHAETHKGLSFDTGPLGLFQL